MKAYVMIAPGFEIAEATLPIDILRRAKVDVKTVSITPENIIEASDGVEIVTDCLLEDTDLMDGDLLFLPGGMPGSRNLFDCDPLQDAIRAYDKAGKWLCAVCAGPTVFGRMGLLKGISATCYPGFEQELKGADVQKKTIVRDKHFITGCGAGAGFAIGREMAAVLVGEEAADTVLRQIMYQVYE